MRAVFSSNKNSIHVVDLPKPGVEDIPDGRGVVALAVPLVLGSVR